MPHCVIEYSNSLQTQIEVKTLLESVQKGALASALFSTSDVKSRAIGFNDFVMGGGETYFVHVAVRLLSGRSLLQKQSLSSIILAHLNEWAQETGVSDISLSVEVIDIDKPSYAKAVLAPTKD